MDKTPQPKDEALEALDFIVNVLKEHERDLDKIVNELSNVTEKMGGTGELTNKITKIEEKINILQKEFANLILNVSSGGHKTEPQISAVKQLPINTAIAAPVISSTGPSVVLNCKQWDDFQALAKGAQTASFTYKVEEKTFQANALKGNKIIAYSGQMPKFSSVIKVFLSKELGVQEQNIVEGTLTRE